MNACPTSWLPKIWLIIGFNSVAFVIPNAIEISTIHTKHLFASFLSRDQSYDLIVSIWRHHHPEEIRVRDRSATVSTTETDTNDETKSEVSYEDEDGRKKKYRFKRRVPSVLKSLVSSKDSPTDGQTESEKIKEEAQDRDGGGSGHETTYPGEEFKNVVMEINLTTSPEKAYELMFRDLEFLRPFWKDNQGLKGELNSLPIFFARWYFDVRYCFHRHQGRWMDKEWWIRTRWARNELHPTSQCLDGTEGDAL